MVTIERIADKIEPYEKYMGREWMYKHWDLADEVPNQPNVKMYGSF